MATSGGESRDLSKEFLARLGKQFTELESKSVHTQLDGIIGSERVNYIMDKMAQSQDEWNISASDYGHALACTLASVATPKIARDMEAVDKTKSPLDSETPDNSKRTFAEMASRTHLESREV